MVDLNSNIWDLPRVQRYIQQIVEDICNGTSLWILYPPWIAIDNFTQLLYEYIEDAQLLQCVLDIGDPAADSPTRFLQKTFPVLSKYQYLEQMANESALPEAMFIINFQHCPTGRQNTWANIPHRWSNACRTNGSKHSIIFITPAAVIQKLKVPQSDVLYSYRYLTGFPTALEARMLCRMEANDQDAQAVWKENLLPSLIGPDMLLGELLWDVIEAPLEKIEEQLRLYGKNMGWTAEKIRARLNNLQPESYNPLSMANATDQPFYSLGEGYFWYTPEYGVEMHSAASALLNRHEAIRHRVWRAQVSLILPIVDKIRVQMCAAISSNNHVSTLASSRLPEFDELNSFINTLSTHDPLRTQWQSIVQNTWAIRNSLAHYQPISYQQFYMIWSNYHRTKNGARISQLY